jgi:hypothetical protein
METPYGITFDEDGKYKVFNNTLQYRPTLFVGSYQQCLIYLGARLMFRSHNEAVSIATDGIK